MSQPTSIKCPVCGSFVGIVSQSGLCGRCRHWTDYSAAAHRAGEWDGTTPAIDRLAAILESGDKTK